MSAFLSILFIFCLCMLHIAPISSTDRSFLVALQEAEQTVNAAINKIASDWSIDQYPNFLRTVGSSRADWDVLVKKFKRKIVQAATTTSSAVPVINFTISFMGSSVAAGHDSPFKLSFPVLVGEKMAPILGKLNVRLESRNVAMGNNPCMPYDVCVQTFAGRDADIVHWEQSYNCAHGDNQRVLEQFVRQAINMQNRPVIAFTDSDTPNWRKADCPANLNEHYNLTVEEKSYLKVYHSGSSGISNIVTDNSLNKKSIFRKFGYLSSIIRQYKGVAAVQLWDHSNYREYKCRGPYVQDWHGRNAKWHPSEHGHRLRADHHVFFWLAAWRDAIASLRETLPRPAAATTTAAADADALLRSLDQHFASSSPTLTLPRPLVVSNLSDHIQCFTNYEPRSERDSSLHSLVVGGRAKVDHSVDLASSKRFTDKGSSEDNIGWKTEIYEALASAKIVTMASRAGYLDYKVVMYGNVASGPLSLLLHTHRADGNIFLCEAPPVWGKMMKGFAPLWNASVELYVTDMTGDKRPAEALAAPDSQFVFQREKALRVEYAHTRVDELCMQVMQKLPVGRFVLTIVPGSSRKVTLATLLVP